MGTRRNLHEKLCEILGSRNVYYRPPEDVKMKYPCIVYDKDSESTDYADDIPYRRAIRYSVTVIDADPDSLIPSLVANLQTASFNRHYTSSNLNHDVYTLFY